MEVKWKVEILEEKEINSWGPQAEKFGIYKYIAHSNDDADLNIE